MNIFIYFDKHAAAVNSSLPIQHSVEIIRIRTYNKNRKAGSL